MPAVNLPHLERDGVDYSKCLKAVTNNSGADGTKWNAD
jgi:hypothetical protein